MSPREYADRYAPWAAIGADPSEGRSLGSTAAALGLFAAIALPIGLLISAANTRKQERAEKAVFRRAGMDWEQRFQYPK